jgi:hypothetical protein
MDKKNIQSILRDALENEIPPDEIKLWPAVKADLVAGQQQAEKMKKMRPRLLSKAVIATLVVIALLTVAFLTPQGRAFAQNVFQFFTRTESKIRPLPPEKIPSPEEAQAISTVQAPVPLASMNDAEKSAGFDAKELPSVPKGFEFVGAMAIEGGLSIQYQAQGNGGQLVINEITNGFMESDWDQSPADAITQVKVGDLDAEIVQGAFVVYAGESVARWNPDAPVLRLRWIEDGIWYEMTKFGNVEAIEYLDQAGMIALAESLVYAP